MNRNKERSWGRSGGDMHSRRCNAANSHEIRIPVWMGLTAEGGIWDSRVSAWLWLRFSSSWMYFPNPPKAVGLRETEDKWVQWFLVRELLSSGAGAFWKLWECVFLFLIFGEGSPMSFHKVGSRDARCLAMCERALHNRYISILYRFHIFLALKQTASDVWTQMLFNEAFIDSLLSRKCNWGVNWKEYCILLCLEIYQKLFIISENYALVHCACCTQWWVLLCPGAGIRPLQYICYYIMSKDFHNEICMVFINWYPFISSSC